MNRRDFIKRTAGAVAATSLAGAVTAEQAVSAPLTATTVRTLGKTGIEVTLLGMGSGVKAWNGQSELTRLGRDACLEVIRHAYEKGIRYFDMADQYGIHFYMGQLLRHGPIERDKCTFLTKTSSREPDLVRADLERFRKELDTDRLDIVLLHCMTDGNWPEALGPCMEVLEEAKQKGIIRAHGVSCHEVAALEQAATCPWVDVVLARINPFGVKMDGPVENVVPLVKKAHENGKGVLGMKIVGEGQLADKLPESLRFAMELGVVDAMPIGFLASDEIDGAMAHIDAIGKTLAGA